jgi:alpha-tubulin suppressor-like RCC1 family protein
VTYSHDYWNSAEGASCALRPGGEVWCWGRFYAKTPAPVGNLSDAVSVDGGKGYFCSRTTGKLVKCWGVPADGALGGGLCGGNPQTTAQPASWLEGVAVATAGGAGGLAVKADGSLWGWGADDYGQLGLGATAPCRSTPVELTPKGVLAADLNSLISDSMSVVLLKDGTVQCSGSGLPGNGNTTGSGKVFVPVSDLKGIVAVDAGVNHRLALDKDGVVWGWGKNAYGQTGDGSKMDRATPAKAFGQPGKAKALAAGFEMSCALYEDSTVWCWGRNHEGQLGNGTNFDSVVPVKVKDLTEVAQVDAEGSHVCAVRKDGSAWCWGDNEFNQLGDGTAVNRSAPVAVAGSLP